MPPTLSALIDEVETSAPSDAPLDLLATASSNVEELTDLTDALLSHFVDRCRRAGHSWAEIGQSLGVTRQAVQQRFTGDKKRVPREYERFTGRAKTIVDEHVVAAARELGHNYMGTEHLLLAFWGDPECLAVVALERLGVTRDAVRSGILERTEEGTAPEPSGGFTPRVWAALGASLGRALSLGHNYVGTEHLLLALLGGVGGVAADVLAEHDVDHDKARDVVVELLSGYPAS
jgi:ATP-dependent Clp protease ATP-binding subunit ClpA